MATQKAFATVKRYVPPVREIIQSPTPDARKNLMRTLRRNTRLIIKVIWFRKIYKKRFTTEERNNNQTITIS